MAMNNDKLIEKLSNLQLQENALRRGLDNVYYKNIKERTRLFNEIKKVKKEIEKVKFQIRLRREIEKNENNHTK